MDMDEPEVDPAMMAAMGFSTFGQQHSKKRKHGEEIASTAAKGPAPQQLTGTGPPATEASVASAKPQRHSSNIPGLGLPITPPEVRKAKRKQQQVTGLAAFLDRGQAIKVPIQSDNPIQKVSQPMQQPTQPKALGIPHAALPERAHPYHPVSGSKSGDPSPNRPYLQYDPEHWRSGREPGAADSLPFSEQEMRALAHGVRNEHGDMVYFLPSFIEDPWAKLRQH